MIRGAAALAACGAVAAALLAPAPAAGAARFAVVAGNDRGDTGRPKLWYAQKDADRFERALVELGDFDAANVVLLQGKGPGELEAAVRALEPRIALAKAAGERTLLVVYYSGHAGAGGLEMGAEKLPFDALRALVSGSPADAKVAIVDACEAGLLTQVKGASAAPALAFAIPAEDAVQGTAFIASTAVGEAAQESAALGGSFFTHHLEIALRGAGDADGDGRVTLVEAFRYTSARTAAGTSGTQAGTQHATYELRMSGRGDVVLSDLRKAEARLLVPPDPRALFILKGPQGLFAEVPGGAVETTLAIPSGHYRIERRAPEGRATADLDVERGRTAALPRLEPTRYELARAKGGPRPGLLYTGVGLAWVGLPGFRAAPAARIGVRKEVGPLGVRVRFDYANASNVQDQWLRYDYQLTAGALAVLYPLNTGKILVEAGLEGGYGYATQKARTPNVSSSLSFSSGVGLAGAALMATAPVGPIRVGLDASAGAQLFTLDGTRTVRPSASVALLALYGF
ncbi:caspase family protein [Anaeromyxobacter oryzae]|uniref:Peptidase C14 caspase domain-containing protein n=1 Tax=Anaeromyxobacter oryzae TaxID=2918170 RepID=A0ABM7WV67_9BACT|nr:caspase family protein [Anaeromyxobacter oryzae]BDG03389.1 hypothetical protein AMOR_23850 [Anaeromyxobacter oryzae]